MALRILRSSVLSALLTVGVLMVSLPLVATPAEAWTLHGCQYVENSINPITYRFRSVGSVQVTAFKNAEAAWDATSAPGYFKETSLSWDPEIDVYDGSYAGTWVALTSWTCTGGYYNGNEVRVKFDTVDLIPYGTSARKDIAIHELGHAYGLGHTYAGCRVMLDGLDFLDCSASFPASNDVSGVQVLY